MDDTLTLLEKLGVPALITAAGSALIGRLRRRPQMEPAKELLQWLDSEATRHLTANDEVLADALAELGKAIAFERAFGIRAEAGRRDALLRFWRAMDGRFTMREVGQGSRSLAWDGERFQSRSVIISYSDRTIRLRALISRHRRTFFAVAMLTCYGLVLVGFSSEFTINRVFYTALGLALLAMTFVWSAVVDRHEVSDALIRWSNEAKKIAAGPNEAVS